MAFYSQNADVIKLPYPEAFKDAESYAATKAHELTHWTKHASRLDRDLGGTAPAMKDTRRKSLSLK